MSDQRATACLEVRGIPAATPSSPSHGLANPDHVKGHGGSAVEAAKAAVRTGLSAAVKTLPAWLFYDREGSELFEAITELPEYYLTRAERSIFEDKGSDIVRAVLSAPCSNPAAATEPPRLSVMELGAGTATKSQILLAAALQQVPRVVFAPVDVSGAALEIADARLRAELPEVRRHPIVGDHRVGVAELARLTGRRLVLFIGSSMGNFTDAENVALFASVQNALAPGDAMLVGADRAKGEAELVAAYDDAQGITAAFNKNILKRINRDLHADFDLDGFAHVARFNAAASRIEMHLESTREQRVRIAAIDLNVAFRRGETIHTESSVKYADARIASILTQSGFVHETTFFDTAERFGVHLARVV